MGDAVTISIPADATGKELKLTIEKVLDTQNLLTANDVLASPIYEILKNFSENFGKPVSLTFAFDKASLKSNQKAAVFYYDEAKKSWVKVGGKVNGDHITVDVNHFTKYAVFAGIVQGKGGNEFAPQDHATRAEAVTVLLNMLAQQGK